MTSRGARSDKLRHTGIHLKTGPILQEPALRNMANNSEPTKVIAFAFDSGEVSQVRRLRSLIALGYNLHVFSMRRGDRSAPIQTDFPNTHLFWTQHEKLTQRVFILFAAVLKLFPYRAQVGSTDVLIARNLDMLIIAWFARLLAGTPQVPLIYECLDIHKTLTGSGIKARLFRKAERWLLCKTQMVIVSSPKFIQAYFDPVQHYVGPYAVWENLVVPDASLPARTKNLPVSSEGNILRIGWVGSIRCAPSLRLLASLAKQLGPAIEIHIHGSVHEHAVPGFYEIVSAHENMLYHGAYTYPTDLSRVYSSFDLVWNIDLWMSGGNSDWCLSNRLYEAGWCGRPSLALEGTEIARYVDEHKMGWTLPSVEPECVAAFFKNLSRSRIAAISTSLLARPESNFKSDGSELHSAIQKVVQAPKRTNRRSQH